jgi:hypothetical protein
MIRRFSPERLPPDINEVQRIPVLPFRRLYQSDHIGRGASSLRPHQHCIMGLSYMGEWRYSFTIPDFRSIWWVVSFTPLSPAPIG